MADDEAVLLEALQRLHLSTDNRTKNQKKRAAARWWKRNRKRVIAARDRRRYEAKQRRRKAKQRRVSNEAFQQICAQFANELKIQSVIVAPDGDNV